MSSFSRQASGAVKPPSEWPHDHDSATAADCLHDGVAVLLPTGRLVLNREIDGDSVVPALVQRRRNEVPVPRAPAISVDERESSYRGHATRGPRVKRSPILATQCRM